ncbi:hypothetical protein EDD33_0847 [Nocardioides aurantiacus]|uniref:Uncharacterized protein n=1 Tax=Nocardioides aurantiacus TaxID=86796 RepID=A0A3N2CR55_9ACTN|nr:hypothetical protein EDD33_0847 [Nocardioides aurantiacus]
MIFVVLALAWAVYLIPKALAHHDEVAGERLEEGHSEKVRVLTRRRHPVDEAAPDAVEEVETEVEVERTDTVTRRTAPVLSPTARAARNRRRVLGGLVTVLLAVVALAGFAVAPWWTVAVPATAIVAFLVVARISVRRTQAARRSAPRPAADPVEPSATVERPASVEPVETTAPVETRAPVAPAALSYEALELLTDPTTGREQQAELEAALADEGSLWDPLPLTLPTYVGKATARRTVRTIELTGMTSSGHDDADTAIARQADEDADRASAETTDRKVAGA